MLTDGRSTHEKAPRMTGALQVWQELPGGLERLTEPDQVERKPELSP